MKSKALALLLELFLSVFLIGCSEPSKSNLSSPSPQSKSDNEVDQCISTEQKINSSGKTLKELLLRVSKLKLSDDCLTLLKISCKENTCKID
jgi:hypothetical protein